MIRYTLKCPKGHHFESWFRSSQAFDALCAAGQLSCAECGASGVEKALMAPKIQDSRKREPQTRDPQDAPQTDEGTKTAPLAKLREHIERHSDYVGASFAAEARAIHEGRATERPIHGEAKIEDARALIEDGIAVLPLPFVPKAKLS